MLASYQRNIEVLATRLDPASKVLAAQDLRHIAQEERENVRDFTCRLEKTFHKAYGNDVLLPDTLLYAQLQEGLSYELMKAPSVSGCIRLQDIMYSCQE